MGAGLLRSILIHLANLQLTVLSICRGRKAAAPSCSDKPEKKRRERSYELRTLSDAQPISVEIATLAVLSELGPFFTCGQAQGSDDV